MTINLLAALFLAAAPVAGKAAELDGTQWKMRFRSQRAWLPVWKGDRLTFESGQFKSEECASYGFQQSDYGEKAAEGSEIWSSTQFNADGERTDWKGILEGDRMNGTFTWSKPDGQTRTYKFSAERQPAKGGGKRVASGGEQQSKG